jgi:diguanylate cyclase (GGDEF)-like protein
VTPHVPVPSPPDRRDDLPVTAASRASRNSFSGRRQLPFRSYVSVVIALGSAVLVASCAELDWSAVVGMEPAFWALCALLLGAELRPLLTAGTREGQVLTTAVVFAVLLRYGLPAAVLLQAVATTVTDLTRSAAPWRTSFNVAQYALSWALAAAAMNAVGLSPGGVPEDLLDSDLGAALVGAATYFVSNQLLVTVVLALKLGRPLWQTLREDLPYELVTNGGLLALSPLVVLAVEEGVSFMPLLLPPVFVVYKVAGIALERERQALTDALTGLPNRKRLAEDTAEALELADGSAVSLLLFDLDRFKEVNDTLGHHVGDRLIQLIGERVSGALRPQDTVARLGGDEFAVLLPGTDAQEAQAIAGRQLQELRAPILLGGVQLDVRASVGVAIAPEHGGTLDELLQHADVAMYLAKEQGGGVELYAAERDRNSTSRLRLLAELREALAQDQLEVHYQPKADLVTGRVDGVEALVRWQHPERGLVPPDAFVPLAETCGLIEQLTAQVLDRTLAQLAVWHADGLELSAAVNVTVRDLSGGSLVGVVREALVRHAVPPRCLQLEVTEGSLFTDSEVAATTLAELDALGTGYSSLGHLRRLPVQELKIDRSFVSGMCDDASDRAIVRSVVDLARGLGMRVVAEGVEDQRTWDALREIGCDAAQGWHLSRPHPADRLTPWLQAHRLTSLVGAPPA